MLAVERGWNWGIARGVSDDFHTHMPENMEHWLTPAGGMRIDRHPTADNGAFAVYGQATYTPSAFSERYACASKCLGPL